jgi:hypothetical protein
MGQDPYGKYVLQPEHAINPEKVPVVGDFSS